MSTLKNLILYLCLLQAGLLLAQDIPLSNNTTLIYSGNVGAESWYFPQTAPLKSYPDYVNSIKGRLDLTLQFDIPFELTLNQRFQFDPDNKDRNRYEI